MPANGVRETKGMRESGSLEKIVQCIPASPISWLPGRRSRREGMSKSGSCKENVLGSFFVAELEGIPRAQGRGAQELRELLELKQELT